MEPRRFCFADAASALSRYILSAVFLFSGFVKAVDPMGGAIKFGEYVASVGLDLPYELAVVCAVALAAFEFGLGMCLLLNVGRRISTGLVMAMMIFFTLLTLVIAIWNPVPDCGCFGDAVKLTNWQTFFKNVILLPMSVLLFVRNGRPFRSDIRVDFALMAVFFALVVPVSMYAIKHLPLIDFMPFKVGVNIPEAMETDGEIETTLLYRDLQSGEVVEFGLDDTEWYDTLRYEFVDTKIVQSELPDIAEFSIYRAEENVTEEILSAPNVVLVMGPLYGEIDSEHIDKVSELLTQARDEDYETYYLCSKNTNAEYTELGEHILRTAFVDDITRKMMLRNNFGVVVLQQGTIVAKWNAGDIPPTFTERLRRPKN